MAREYSTFRSRSIIVLAGAVSALAAFAASALTIVVNAAHACAERVYDVGLAFRHMLAVAFSPLATVERHLVETPPAANVIGLDEARAYRARMAQTSIGRARAPLSQAFAAAA